MCLLSRVLHNKSDIRNTQSSIELFKGFIRKYFSKYVYQYNLGRNIMKFDLFLLDIIMYKVMPNINVFSMRVRNWIVS